MSFVSDIRNGKLLLPEDPIHLLDHENGMTHQLFLVSVYMPLIGSRVSCILSFDKTTGELVEFFPSDFQTEQPMDLQECNTVDFEWVEGSELAHM